MIVSGMIEEATFGAGSRATGDGAAAFAAVEIHTRLETVDALWRSLLGVAVATPYQTPDFLGAWVREAAPHEGVEPMIVVARDARGEAVALLPFGVRRRLGLKVASFLGGSHVNYNMPVVRADRLTGFAPAETERLMREAARLGDVAGFSLSNQPFAWNGTANPFAALPRQPSPDAAYCGPLAATIEDHLKTALSAKTRSAQRRKLRRFEEQGPVALYRADAAGQREKVLEAYFRQKAERLGARGIDNVFEKPGVQAFIRAAAGLDGRRQAIDLYGFDVGGATVATFGVIADGERMCGMFNSITSCDLSRYSPGELLLNFMVEDAIARGVKTFDLGVGAASYKALHCPIEEPLFDSVFGVTASGRAAAWALGALRLAKARVKANPTAYGLVTRFRKLRAKPATDAEPRSGED